MKKWVFVGEKVRFEKGLKRRQKLSESLHSEPPPPLPPSDHFAHVFLINCQRLSD